ncbi:carbohydrate ABC transporter permease [Deinococcus psychrotolerans]|uniref:carbohydrate ABC transporter permease n=1 Tax=Deinococcus psychrotolerans TaxID=2489213 RepID=UPI0019D1038F|nr:carbohydrate ABC transporter permease [Deinococcus psychrotolerans]
MITRHVNAQEHPRTRSSLPPLTLLAYLLIGIGGVVMMLPLAWMVSASFKPMSEIIQVPPTWIPQHFTFRNYQQVFAEFPFARYFLNSVVTTLLIILSVLISSVSGGYALAKFRLPGQHVILILFLLALMVPFQSLMVPTYQLMVSLHLVNTYAGVVYPFLFSATGIFLMRQFISDLPSELIEAARIDGASEPRILMSVILPLLGPALAALTILEFSSAWEEFLWPSIITSSDATRTIPIGLQYFAEQYGTRIDLQMAGSTLAALPVILGFLLLQKQFIEGIALTGVKG